MVAVSHRYGIVYFPIHKNASTSLKKMLYEVDTGKELTEKSLQHLGSDLHRLYPYTSKERWEKYYGTYVSLTVVRDPLERLLSAYSQFIVHQHCLEEPAVATQLRAVGLSLSPSPDEFVQHFAAYRSVSFTLRRHTHTQHSYIGNFFEKIGNSIRFERLQEFGDIVGRLTGKKLAVPHEKKGRTKFYAGSLSTDSLAKVARIFRDDYAMLSAFYLPPVSKAD